jgi:NAD(P)-dependent dehydrogenase (short-subunit alcohol dehydrogenase family)
MFFCLRREVAVMKKQGSGVIVNIASIAGHVGFAGTAVYTAAKHAALGLTKAAALETARHGVRVCAISPGAVDTPMTDRFTGYDEQAKLAMIAGVPLGRLCKPEEIARGALWLCSPDAALMVGQTLNLDGGWANVKA